MQDFQIKDAIDKPIGSHLLTQVMNFKAKSSRNFVNLTKEVLCLTEIILNRYRMKARFKISEEVKYHPRPGHAKSPKALNFRKFSFLGVIKPHLLEDRKLVIRQKFEKRVVTS